MTNKDKNLAVFDLDGTLIIRQSQKLFLEYLLINKKVSRCKVLPIFFWFLLNKLGIINSPNKAFEYAVVVFKEFKYDDLMKLTNDFVNNHLLEHLNQRVLKSLNDHLRKKDEIVLISSAFDILVEQVAKKLNINIVISTKITYSQESVNSIKVVYGKDKKDLFLKKYGQKISDYKDIFVYSDSISDLPIFSIATKAIAVNPDKKLKKIASRKRWLIIK